MASTLDAFLMLRRSWCQGCWITWRHLISHSRCAAKFPQKYKLRPADEAVRVRLLRFSVKHSARIRSLTVLRFRRCGLKLPTIEIEDWKIADAYIYARKTHSADLEWEARLSNCNRNLEVSSSFAEKCSVVEWPTHHSAGVLSFPDGSGSARIRGTEVVHFTSNW